MITTTWTRRLFVAGAVLFGSYQVAQAQVQPAPTQTQPQTNDYSDEELQQFTKVALSVNDLEMNAQEQSIAAIEGENLDIDRFNEIAEYQQQNLNAQEEAAQAEVDTSSAPTVDELAAFNKAGQQIMQIRQETTESMIQAIQAGGMAPERFQQIMMAYQENDQLRQRIDAMLMEQAPEPQKD
ncbi:protein of unknown function [Catalinimonas alkaloidigena]|uniref:DUF4168 domain-containing protein n=1 Tax=Catalinimonas alkaloidigena TaxID=1075417 RepID=A0A1G9QE11_9BACT|nr:DUF4168 domain-containing protein [Catalinimonas alkaloidigena]SDM08971.1 protein of unknown function [Catalinimonas alkaloidigena]